MIYDDDSNSIEENISHKNVFIQTPTRIFNDIEGEEEIRDFSLISESSSSSIL